MSATVGIKDSKTGVTARVTPFGQLVVAPLQYSTPIGKEILAINQAVNFITPVQDQSIVITDIFASADKNVSTNTAADVVIYEADSEDTIDEANVIIRPQLLRSDNVGVSGLNLLVGEGRWVNAKTSDTGILLTIMYYRVPVENY